MDKTAFITEAPQYYSLAIMAYLGLVRGAVTHLQLRGHYFDADIGRSYLNRDRLFELALTWLSQKGMIDVTPDPFGSPIIAPSADFDVHYKELLKDRNFPLYKYEMIERNQSWLHDALRNLDHTFALLDITDEDFERPDTEWEPLPLEREDPQLQKIIETVDDTVEKVRVDNGYAANLPEERKFILDNLSALSKRLKESSTISFAYLKQFAFSPLSKLLKRFKDHAIGFAAFAAKEAFREFLRKRGMPFFDEWFCDRSKPSNCLTPVLPQFDTTDRCP